MQGNKDIALLAATVGIVSTLLEVVLSAGLSMAGLIKTPLYIFVGRLSVGELPSPPWVTTTLGLIGHLFTGAIFAFFFIVFLQIWGSDRIYLKGLGYGGTLYLIHEVVIPNIITTDITLQRSPYSLFFHIITALIWGLTAAYIYKRITGEKESLSTQNEQTKSLKRHVITGRKYSILPAPARKLKKPKPIK